MADEPKLTDRERKIVERLGYTLIGAAGLLVSAIPLSLVGLEKSGLVVAIAGGVLGTVYTACVHPPIVPPQDNKYRQLIRRYDEEEKENE